MTDPQPILAQLTTAPNPGAVAIIHLHGQALPLLVALTGRNDWPIARLQLARFGELDEGLAVRLSGDAAQLMPHGGPRVVQKLMERLSALGAVITGESPAEAIYPEAGSPIEADVLAAIAAAASPAAIDLLAAQPANWRAWFAADSATRPPLAPASLRHLLTPPTVALVGPANVGKSTLTNRLLGRSVSIVADLPGTTRDWVAGLVELPAAPPEPAHDESDAPPTSPSDPTRHAVAVRWLDTPGLRQSGDAVEQRAIALAARVVRSADVLIAIRERAGDWPSPDTLPRTPDLRVVTKIDQPGPDPEPDAIAVSGTTGQGLDALQQAILKALGLARLPSPQTALWPFSDRLRDAMQAESDTRLAAYLGCAAS